MKLKNLKYMALVYLRTKIFRGENLYVANANQEKMFIAGDVIVVFVNNNL